MDRRGFLAKLGGGIAAAAGVTAATASGAQAPGASLDSEIAALQTDDADLQQRVKTLEQEVAALQAAPAPTPDQTTAPAAGGVGLYQLGGSLAGCSHLHDDTYSLLIGDWADAALLASCAAAEKYVYTVTTSGVTPGTENEYVILGTASSSIPNSLTPAAYAQKCVSLVKANPGLNGIFVDNLLSNIPGILDALQAVSAVFRQNGVRWCANVGGYIAGNPGSDDGTLWQSWAKQAAPYLDRLMLENWQEAPSTGNVRLRGNEWYNHWDSWQNSPAVAPGKFLGVSYGPAAHGVYGRASMLTAPGADPGNVFCWNVSNGSGDPYDTVWTTKTPHPVVDPVAGTASL